MKIKKIEVIVAVSIVMNVVMLGTLAYIAKLDRKIEFTLNQPNVVYLEKSPTGAAAAQSASGDAIMAAAVK